jgi:hypothetical protein
MRLGSIFFHVTKPAASVEGENRIWLARLGGINHIHSQKLWRKLKSALFFRMAFNNLNFLTEVWKK